MSLEAGEERQQLLPVLNTMLKFDDEELRILKIISSQGQHSSLSHSAAAAANPILLPYISLHLHHKTVFFYYGGTRIQIAYL